jgi:hypothetical protein
VGTPPSKNSSSTGKQPDAMDVQPEVRPETALHPWGPPCAWALPCRPMHARHACSTPSPSTLRPPRPPSPPTHQPEETGPDARLGAVSSLAALPGALAPLLVKLGPHVADDMRLYTRLCRLLRVRPRMLSPVLCCAGLCAVYSGPAPRPQLAPQHTNPRDLQGWAILTACAWMHVCVHRSTGRSTRRSWRRWARRPSCARPSRAA